MGSVVVATNVSVFRATITRGGTMDHFRAGRLSRPQKRNMNMAMIAYQLKVSYFNIIGQFVDFRKMGYKFQVFYKVGCES